jgi:hypothetical protein
MKKLLLISAIAAFATTSCSKDRTCTCTDSGGGTNVTTLVGVSNGQAKANCVSKKYTDPTTGETDTETCKLN